MNNRNGVRKFFALGMVVVFSVPQLQARCICRPTNRVIGYVSHSPDLTALAAKDTAEKMNSMATGALQSTTASAGMVSSPAFEQTTQTASMVMTTMPYVPQAPTASSHLQLFNENSMGQHSVATMELEYVPDVNNISGSHSVAGAVHTLPHTGSQVVTGVVHTPPHVESNVAVGSVHTLPHTGSQTVSGIVHAPSHVESHAVVGSIHALPNTGSQVVGGVVHTQPHVESHVAIGSVHAPLYEKIHEVPVASMNLEYGQDVQTNGVHTGVLSVFDVNQQNQSGILAAIPQTKPLKKSKSRFLRDALFFATGFILAALLWPKSKPNGDDRGGAGMNGGPTGNILGGDGQLVGGEDGDWSESEDDEDGDGRGLPGDSAVPVGTGGDGQSNLGAAGTERAATSTPASATMPARRRSRKYQGPELGGAEGQFGNPPKGHGGLNSPGAIQTLGARGQEAGRKHSNLNKNRFKGSVGRSAVRPDGEVGAT
jgi:hypothetical protein